MLSDNDNHMHQPLTDNILARGVWYGTRHQLCMFHLVFKPFAAYVKLPPYLKGKRKSNANKHVKLARDWVLSWFRYCESNDEITVSKLHLHAWLSTPHVRQIMSKATAKSIMTTIDTCIWPLYDKWARPYKMFIRSFDECTSNAVEHENWSVKEGGDVVHASMSIDTSANVMNCKTFHRNKVKKQNFAAAVTSTPLWSKTETSDSICTHAEDLLKEEWNARSMYASVRLTAIVWYVRSTWKASPFTLESPYTKFTRVRIVNIVMHEGKAYLVCSCGFHHMHGIPCRHILHITEKVLLEYFDPRWYKIFYHFYGRDPEITRLFNHTRDNPVPGCMYDGDLSPCESTLPAFKGQYLLSYFDQIVHSIIPVVSNPTPFLDVGDITPELLIEKRAPTQLSLTHRFHPLGLGSTVCMTNETATLHESTSPARTSSQAEASNQNVMFNESGSPGFTSQFAEAIQDNTADESEDDNPVDIMEDMRQVFFDIAEMVENKPSLRKKALNQMKALHQGLVADYCKDPHSKFVSTMESNKTSRMVSYNPPAESQKIR